MNFQGLPSYFDHDFFFEKISMAKPQIGKPKLCKDGQYLFGILITNRDEYIEITRVARKTMHSHGITTDN